MNAGKHVICEKPMALSLAECDRMIQVCEDRGVLLQINHNRRWHAQWCRAQELIREGAIGGLFQMVCYFDGGKPAPSWRSDNEGPLLHDFTHYFDMMDAFGGEVDWLCGMAEQRQRPWAIEDFAAAFMKYRNGVTGLVHAAERSDYTDTDFQLRGRNGTITMAWDTLRLSESVPATTSRHPVFNGAPCNIAKSIVRRRSPPTWSPSRNWWLRWKAMESCAAMAWSDGGRWNW